LRSHRFASIFAASLIALTPVHAWSQPQPDDRVSVSQRPRPEYDPAGRNIGAFTLNARLDLSVTSTDNLFAEETGADEDVFLDIAPWVGLNSNWLRHALGAEVGANFRQHDDFSSENFETAFARAFGRLDVGSNTTVTGRLGIANEVEPRTDPDAPLTPEPVEYDRTDASLTVQHTFNRFRVTGTAATTDFDYKGSQDFRDHEANLVRGRLDAEVTPRIGVFLQAEADERDYDNLSTLSSDGEVILAGVVVNFTDLMRGELGAGQFERDYDTGASVDGTAIYGTLEWYLTRLTTISFDANRSTEDVIGGTTLSPYVATRFGARVDHELRRNIILTVGARVGDRDYETIDRDDEFFYADAGADFLINRRVVLRARITHEEVESDGIDRYRDFEVDTATLGVSLRL
jgi:hypothetical protein